MNCEEDTSSLCCGVLINVPVIHDVIVLGNGRIGQASRTECAVRGAYLGLNLSLNGRVTDGCGRQVPERGEDDLDYSRTFSCETHS